MKRTDSRPVSFRIPRHTERGLRSLAEEDGVSMSQVLWRLVDEECGRRHFGHGAWAELERAADVEIVAGPKDVKMIDAEGRPTTIAADHVVTARFDHATVVVPLTDEMHEDFDILRDVIARSMFASAADVAPAGR